MALPAINQFSTIGKDMYDEGQEGIADEDRRVNLQENVDVQGPLVTLDAAE